MTSGGGMLFSFIPSFQSYRLALLQNPTDFPKFRFVESLVPTQSHRTEPELCFGAPLVNMNMGWLIRF
jgi:hypothetical protein